MNFIIKDGILLKYNGKDSVVIVPDGVKIIASEAFNGNTNLEKLILPESLEVFQGVCLYDCINLKEIVLPSKLKVLDITVLEPIIENYYGKDKVFYTINNYLLVKLSKNMLFSEPLSDMIDINKYENFTYDIENNYLTVRIPDDAKIGLSKLNGYDSINELIFPEGFTEIRDTFIEYFTKLERVVFPSTLSVIKNNPFYECHSLKEIVLNNNVYFNVYMNGLYSKDYSILYSYYGDNIILHNNLKIIGKCAFSNSCCNYFDLPDTIEKICDFAFLNNTEIDTLKIHSSVKFIGYYGLYTTGTSKNLVFEKLDKSVEYFVMDIDDISNNDNLVYDSDTNNCFENIIIHDFDKISTLKKVLDVIVNSYTKSIEICGNLFTLSYDINSTFDEIINDLISKVISIVPVDKYDVSLINYVIDIDIFTNKIFDYLNNTVCIDADFIDSLVFISTEIGAYEAFITLLDYMYDNNLFNTKNLFLE